MRAVLLGVIMLGVVGLRPPVGAAQASAKDTLDAAWRVFARPCGAMATYLAENGRDPAFFSPLLQATFRRAYAALLPVLVQVVGEPGLGDDGDALRRALGRQVSGLFTRETRLYSPSEAAAAWRRVEAAEAASWSRYAAGEPLAPGERHLLALLADTEAGPAWRLFGRGGEPECRLGRSY